MVALSLILVAAVALRCRFIADVFVKGAVLPWGSDSMYHLWRIEAAVKQGAVPRVDPFVNAPDGARVIYPDGFDALLAGVARLSAGADADRFTVQVIVMCAVTLLGAGAVAAGWAAARRCVGSGAALLAAFILALLPSHAFLTVLGRVDHHVFEAALPPLALLALARLLEPGQRAVWPAVLISGALLGALHYLVPAAPLHLAAVAAALWALALRGALARDAGVVRYLLACAAGAGVAALVTLPDALTRQGWAAYEPSWLMTGLLVAAAAGCALLALAARRGPAAFIGVSVVLGLAAAAAAAGALERGIGFVAREGTLSLVVESGPLWAQPLTALRENTWLLLAAPVLLWLLCRRAPPARFALGALGLVGFALTALQLRFVVALMVPLAVAAAHAAARCQEALARRTSARLATAAVALALASALGPALWSYAHTTLLARRSLALFDAAAWMRDNTPAAGARLPGARAPYTVAAGSSAGNLLAYMARRPVLASAMYHADYERGLHAAIEVLYGDNPDAAVHRRKVRYVLVEATDPKLTRFHRRLVGLTPRPPGPFLAGHFFQTEGSMVTRKGAGGRTVVAPGRAHWRLVYDSPYALTGGRKPVPALKIFERVPGARITGACAGGGPVLARTVQRSNRGRRFAFVHLARCRRGAFSMRFPYAGEVQLRGAHARAVKVSPEAVTGGRQVEAKEGK